MSTHNRKFHDKIKKKKSPKMCFLEIMEEFHRDSKISFSHPR